MCIGFLRRILFTEVYGNVTVMAQFYESADGSVQGAQVPFNFLLLDLHGQSDARDFLHKINTWLAYTPLGQTPNWVVGVFLCGCVVAPLSHPIDTNRWNTLFLESERAQLGNHDKQRISDRFGPAAVDAMNMLLLTLPGIAITYNVRRTAKLGGHTD